MVVARGLGRFGAFPIKRGHIPSSKRIGPFDGFEVWDHAHFVFRRPAPPKEKDWRGAGQKANLPFFQSFISRSFQERSAADLACAPCAV